MAKIMRPDRTINGSNGESFALSGGADVPACRNCGAEARSKFCPECGQSTKVGLPNLYSLVHDGLGAFFSYDSKLWRTLVVLVIKPGQLTLDYLDGKRARYLTPFQLFFWLEAIAFLSHRFFFSQNPVEIDLKTKALLVVGVVVVLGLSVMNARKGFKFVANLVAGTHIWSFLMFTLLAEYTIVPGIAAILQRSHIVHGQMDAGSIVTPTAQAIIAFYTVLAIKRVYRTPVVAAILQTAILFGLYKGVAMVFERI